MTDNSVYVPHQLTKNVKLLHKAVIIVDGKALLLKRSPESKSRPEKWDLPGGNSEWPLNATELEQDLHKLDVAREILEEANIIVSKKEFEIEQLVYLTSFFQPEKQVYTMVFGWLVNNLTANDVKDIKISHEHTEFAWVAQNELDNHDFGFDFVKEIIEAGFAKN